MDFFVEIVEKATGIVQTRMGPMGSSQAQRAKRGARINLDHEHFRVRVVDEEGDEVGSQPRM